MIFVLLFSALAVSMATMSGTNVQIAHNQHKINSAFGSAESGLEIMRYWLNRIRIPNSTAPSAVFSTIAASLQNDLTSNGISNITVNYDGSQITIPSVTLVSAEATSFSAVLHQVDQDSLQLDVTGTNGQIRRTIRVNYNIEPSQNPIFDYGLATKGPLHINGNPSLTGINDPQEASIYIESHSDDLALIIKGNTNIAGDISIVNPNAQVNLQGNVSIGGETGQAAIDNHIFTGVDSTEFPTPDPEYFRDYATGDIIDSSTDTSSNMTITNAIVLAGADPVFAGNVEINGIMFIESPNRVRFAGNLTITGLIVADGDVNLPSPQNELIFRGNVHTYPVSQLPEQPQFEQLRQETGSLILAPGFSASFGGNFSTLEGIIAANGVELFGNANGTIKGTVINYSDTPMVLRGNVNLQFDRSDSVEVPAGFDTTRVLLYDPSSYCEIIL
ncbi:MAG: pilus assembly PilX N-terminal domain-containing protein, partial [Sedimentisphaerales bacterium]